MRMVALFLLVLMVFCGCVQMRDYTGIKEGAFGLDIRKGFGEGNIKKDYYAIGDRDGLIIGDTAREVTLKIGLPDKVETTQEGYEAWVYEDRKVKFLFEDGKLRDWQNI